MSLAQISDSDRLVRIVLTSGEHVYASEDAYGNTWLDNELGDSYQLVRLDAEKYKEEQLRRLAGRTDNHWTKAQLKRLIATPVRLRVNCELRTGKSLSGVTVVCAQGVGYVELPEWWYPYPNGRIASISHTTRARARAEQAEYFGKSRA